ncbi:MAG: SprB repeat-containing protein, partial [Bacteroidales bacterium]|nr:SprB repeat-containing protein [Bacteroidales bacterium]
EPMVLTIEAAHTKCNQATGGANVTVSGGTEPFDFMWTNGATTQTITELTSGIYMVSVSDANSCTKTATTTINDTGGATIQASTVVQNTSCNGSDDGFVHLSVLGGIPPYTYTWSNGSTTKDADSLAAGVYEVIVVDADDCANSQSFTISQPDIIGISIVSEGAICGSANGSATATVSGGTAPYTYDWESGAITDTANSLSGGIHNLTVTDANGCQGETKATINELGAPEINLVSVTPARCATSDGKIDISASGGNGVFQYEWSTGDVTQDLKDIAPGDYSVTVSFAEGSCYAIQVFTVPVLTPDPVPICMVTVDDELQANVIVWEKDVDKDEISEFNIYRESSVPDEYMFVATVPYEQESIYIDSNSNPRQKPWKYKMMTTDNCGNTSELSDAHTTIHLTINLGLGDEYNLIWGNYTGIVYTTYNVLRYTTVNGWETLDIVAANFSLYNSWTDMDVPATDSLFYVVEIANTEACLSTKKATSHNSVRSNRTKSTVKSAIGIEDELNDIRNFQLWPNPNTGEFKITANINNTDKVQMKIYDLTGKLFIDKYYY